MPFGSARLVKLTLGLALKSGVSFCMKLSARVSVCTCGVEWKRTAWVVFPGRRRIFSVRHFSVVFRGGVFFVKSFKWDMFL